jgi:ABC-type Na+ efflux pump permease subunit
MSGIKQQNPKFIVSNILSRMLIPFFAIMYTALKESILSPEAGGMMDSWVSMGFSLAFFYMLQVTMLKDDSHRFLRKDLWVLGFSWLILGLLFQFVLFTIFYKIPLSIIMNSYDFTKMEPWPYALVALFLAPRICAIPARNWSF